MMLISRRPAATKKSTLRRVVIYLALLAALWFMLMFVVIPWENSGEIPQDSFKLIEGQRAYAMILRETRPTLATAIRGLNMAGARFTQNKTEEGRTLITGNICIFYDRHGEFSRLEIMRAPFSVEPAPLTRENPVTPDGAAQTSAPASGGEATR